MRYKVGDYVLGTETVGNNVSRPARGWVVREISKTEALVACDDQWECHRANEVTISEVLEFEIPDWSHLSFFTKEVLTEEEGTLLVRDLMAQDYVFVPYLDGRVVRWKEL